MKKTIIGLGLAALGRPEYINVRQEVDLDKSAGFYQKNAFKLLDFAYQHGIRHFDTAPSYGKGEEYLQQWYKKNPYKDLIFSTKWGYTYVANWKIGYKEAHEIKEHSLRKLTEQWSVSKDLIPALKIYQIHSATFESGVLKNPYVLQQLFDIKNNTGVKLGISTSGENQDEVLKFASNIKIKDQFLFESFQVTYNILETSTHEFLKELLAANRVVIVKEALANGRIFRNDQYGHYGNMYSYLEGLSLKYKVSVDAVALRFVMDELQPNVVLSGASNSNQLFDNLAAMKFQLEHNEANTLKQFAVDASLYWNERKKLQWN